MNKNSVLITVLVAVLVGAAAFYGGMQYQKSQRGQFARNGGFGNFAGGQNGANVASRPVRVQILSSDSSSLTVKLVDGSTKLVMFSTATVITEAKKTDSKALSKDKEVLVVGTTNSDGSVSAQDISIGNLGFGGGRRPTQGQ